MKTYHCKKCKTQGIRHDDICRSSRDRPVQCTNCGVDCFGEDEGQLGDLIEQFFPVIFVVLVLLVLLLTFLLRNFIWIIVFPTITIIIFAIVRNTKESTRNIYVKGIDYLD